MEHPTIKLRNILIFGWFESKIWTNTGSEDLDEDSINLCSAEEEKAYVELKKCKH